MNEHMNERLLLQNYLRTLRLPTMLREYAQVARLPIRQLAKLRPDKSFLVSNGTG